MRRRTWLIGAGVVGALIVAAVVLLQKAGLVRKPGTNLETVLANGDAPPDPDAPSAQQQWFIDEIRDATGRELEVDGEFDVYLLPLPGLLLGDARLSNEDGFGDGPFATIEALEIRVGSVSPFDMELEIERAALAGLRLNLMRNAAGESNWSDFGEDAEAAAPAAPDAAPAPAADGNDWKVSLDSFEILDAEIRMQDAFAGRHWTLSGIDIRATGLLPGETFPLEASFAYASGATHLSFESQAISSIPTDRWLLEGLTLTSTGDGPGWIGLLGDATLNVGRLEADTMQSRQTFEGIDLALNALEAADLVAALEALSVTIDPSLVARASASSSIRLSGDGSVDYRTRALAIDGELRLSDGSVVPLALTGTLEAPRVEVVSAR